ncbi:unnamed protein product (macronuclear) [Paramecium tetraurelia]|uniref:Cation efflux protein transmembrane domain-containing protein n=1 Tax=Paramecium tetraurelia TaxID=5888 RepID=A0E0R2_PARTE|nr:uncharacterized protein GSPATT00022047001 [Paramecium tetraurelia]CAK88879.1 unnamed protein product [Paramecium tetraurelia]|eukprot:XP_001456276.1 hypothetical protein (macronuclear) [Paramecium tetraurelia strain d4-2]
MSISETYVQKIPNIFEINTLLMITFILLFVWRIITLKTKALSNPLKILGIATLKLIHYVSSFYSLIMFSFLISYVADQLAFRNLNKIKLIQFFFVIIIFCWGTDINLFSLTLVTLIEKITKKVIQSQQIQKEDEISTILSYVLALVIILNISIYEMLLSEELEAFNIMEFPLFNLLMIGLFMLALQKITYNITTEQHNKFIGVIMCLLFLIYELKDKLHDPFNHQVMWVSLSILAALNIFENTEEELQLIQSNNNRVFGEDEISFQAFINHLKNNSDSKKLMIQLSLNFSFMFVELIYGWISNSLGLITDSLHMLIDSSALAIALFASFMAKRKANSTYTFGFERVEILSGYANGVFLLFAVVEIISESFERVITPQEVLPEKMLIVSFLGLLVNVIGLFFFHNHGHIHSEEVDEQLEEKHHHHCSHHHDHNHNLSGVYLHILADALGSVACIISALLIYYYQFHMADPIASIIISLLILTTTITLLKDTSKILLMHVPYSGKKVLAAISHDFNHRGFEPQEMKLWQYKEKKLIFTARFQIKQSDEDQIKSEIDGIVSKHKDVIINAIDFDYVD